MFRRKQRYLILTLVVTLSLLAAITPANITEVQAVEKGVDICESPASHPFAEARGTRFMVAAAHPLAAEVGCKILIRGGNAVDAAVAV